MLNDITRILINGYIVPWTDFGIAKAPMKPGYLVEPTKLLIGDKREYQSKTDTIPFVVKSIVLENPESPIDYDFQDGDEILVFYLHAGQRFYGYLAPDQIVEIGDLLCLSDTIGMVKKYVHGVDLEIGIVAMACEEMVSDVDPRMMQMASV